MKRSDLSIFVCPKCRGSLELIGAPTVHENEIMGGEMRCSQCSADSRSFARFPRFVELNNYARSFGYQWKKFAKTQVGGEQTKISKIRFDVTTKWSSGFEGPTGS